MTQEQDASSGQTPALDWENEVKFWEEQLSGNGLYSKDVLMRFNTSETHWEYHQSIHNYLCDLGKKMGRKARILDVGSGPASIFLYGHVHGLFDLVAADPLAHSYNNLIKKYDLPQQGISLRVAGEGLSSVFPLDYFDVVWTFNAIDHSQDPVKVFAEITNVLAPGGIALIQCWEREATAANWSGLHQNDFWQDANGEIKIDKRDGTTLTLKDARLQMLDSDFLPLNVYPKSGDRKWLAFAFRKRE